MPKKSKKEVKEEEYDPNQVFEEEEEKEEYDDDDEEEDEIDISKLSPEEKKAIDKNNKNIVFLKALAKDVNQDIPKLAKKCGIREEEGYQVVSYALNIIDATHKDNDFPNRFLAYFDRKVPDNWPNKVYLEDDEARSLVGLVNVVNDKLLNSAKVTDPDKVLGPGVITEQSINREADNRVMLDTQPQQSYYHHQPVQQQPQQQQPEQEPYNEMEDYASRYGAPDIGLMEMALKKIPNNRPGSIPQFMSAFNNLYLDWMTNPMKMLEQLKFFFGPVHGEHAFRLWRDYRDMYVKKYGNAPMGYYGNGMGMNDMYNPYFANTQQQGMQPLQLSPEMMEDRMFDRKMKKMMDAIQLSIMQRSMEIQTPSPIGGQNYEEVLDPNTGKVIKRIFLSNGHSQQQQNPLEGTLINTLSSFFTEALRGMNNEKIELYKKVNTPDNTLTDFAKTMMSNYLNQANPVQQIKEMLEMTNMIKQQSPQADQQKSLEAIKTELDAKLAMREFDLKQMEIQHNWRMDEKQQQEQDSNVDKWLNTMVQLGEGFLKPVAMEFMKGLGGANKNPIGAMFGGGQQQMQPPSSPAEIAQMQQAQAMQEQRMYNPQAPPQQAPMQQQMPPMQPIPPMQRQFNQQPPPQQQRPIAQISDQEINQELSQLSPEQLQEIQDKMALEDASRERVKNAIRSQINARRFNRNQPAPQQQEVQKIFNPPPVDDSDDEELSLSDFDDEDYTPVAVSPQPTQQQVTKKNKFSDFAPESTTETVRKKKLTPQQKEMFATGQLSPQELRNAPNINDEEDFEDDSSVPIAGIRNQSEDEMVKENLKKTRQMPAKKKKSSPQPKKKEEKKEEENIIDEAEKVLADVPDMSEEEIESDEFGE